MRLILKSNDKEIYKDKIHGVGVGGQFVVKIR